MVSLAASTVTSVVPVIAGKDGNADKVAFVRHQSKNKIPGYREHIKGSNDGRGRRL